MDIRDPAQRSPDGPRPPSADTAPVLVWVTGPDAGCTGGNRAWLDFTGQSHAERLGDGWLASVHPDDRRRCREAILTARDARRDFQLEFRLRHRAGDYRPVLVAGLAQFTTTGAFAGYIGSGSDLSARAAADERARELATLLDVARTVAATLELGPLLGLILDQLKGIVDYVAASIVTHDAAAGELVQVEYRGPRRREGRLGLRWPVAASPDWARVRAGQSVIIGDVRGDTPEAIAFRRRGGAIPDHIRCWLAVPLALPGRVLGMLTCSSDRPDRYTPHHAALALALAGQAAVALENARLYEQAQRLAALEERQRLARELHDSVAQALYGIALGAHTAREALDDDPAAARAPLDYVLALAEAGLAELRALLLDLRPETLAEVGLVAALGQQADALRARHRLAVEADLGAEPDLPRDTKEALYRIAREALHNIVKHARARTVALRLARDGPATVLEVRDDGAGFDPDAGFPGHLGLTSMRERAARLGGTLTLTSAPGRGAYLRVRIPEGDRAGHAGR